MLALFAARPLGGGKHDHIKRIAHLLSQLILTKQIFNVLLTLLVELHPALIAELDIEAVVVCIDRSVKEERTNVDARRFTVLLDEGATDRHNYQQDEGAIARHPARNSSH